MVFDQEYRNSYLLGGQVFPRMSLPEEWYTHGVAARAASVEELAGAIGVPPDAFAQAFAGFNEDARAGKDREFGRGESAYDRYYGDPTQRPNPNLRALDARRLYAVRVVLSDLGTCGGLTVDGRARVLGPAGEPIPGLYAIGNVAANAFGDRYPGAGATIGQGLVFGYIAAREATSPQAPAPNPPHGHDT